jgi:hypothetical protein
LGSRENGIIGSREVGIDIEKEEVKDRDRERERERERDRGREGSREKGMIEGGGIEAGTGHGSMEGRRKNKNCANCCERITAQQ